MLKYFLKPDPDIGRISYIRSFYYNYLCKNVIREGAGKLLINKKTKIFFHKNSKLLLEKNNLIIGRKTYDFDIPTSIYFDSNAIWYCKGGNIFSTSILIGTNAILETGVGFRTESLCRIFAKKHIAIGNNVIMARGSTIIDTNAHEILIDGENKDRDKEILIEDNVWICSNAKIMKGVTVGGGSIIGSNAVILHDVPPHSIAVTEHKQENKTDDSLKWIR